MPCLKDDDSAFEGFWGSDVDLLCSGCTAAAAASNTLYDTVRLSQTESDRVTVTHSLRRRVVVDWPESPDWQTLSHCPVPTEAPARRTEAAATTDRSSWIRPSDCHSLPVWGRFAGQSSRRFGADSPPNGPNPFLDFGTGPSSDQQVRKKIRLPAGGRGGSYQRAEQKSNKIQNKNLHVNGHGIEPGIQNLLLSSLPLD